MGCGRGMRGMAPDRTVPRFPHTKPSVNTQPAAPPISNRASYRTSNRPSVTSSAIPLHHLLLSTNAPIICNYRINFLVSKLMFFGRHPSINFHNITRLPTSTGPYRSCAALKTTIWSYLVWFGQFGFIWSSLICFW